MKCSICNFRKTTNLLNLNCGNFDQSILYKFVKISACANCGHIYNQLSSKEIIDLEKYYNNEYSQINLSSSDKTGDRPGSANINTLRRYVKLYSLISPFVNKNFNILDVGCATGGFLNYLSRHGMNNLYGIDISDFYVNEAKKKNICNAKIGSAESIPFPDDSMNLIVMDQVLEHLINPRKVFKEAKRVLSDGGLFCVSVPDSEQYGKEYFFDFFWFLMREHVQHFDIKHLRFLAEQEGFELVDYSNYRTPMMSKKMILPALSVLFRATKKTKIKIDRDFFKLEKIIKHYIKEDFKKLNKKKSVIAGLIKSQKPLYVWGLGREFLYLYENAGLKKCNIAGLIDNTPYKLKNYSINGKKINNKFILVKAMPNSALLISAFAHITKLKKERLSFGYHERVLKL